ncbi:MAG: MATE family efflux transporter [Fibrobacterales bacterium]
MGSKPTSIAKGTAIITLSILLSRVLGLVRNWLLAYVGGASAEVDAYNFAFLLPDLLNHFLASGYLSITLVPLILPLFKEGKQKEASQTFSNIFFIISGVMVVFSTLCWIYADQLLPYLSDKPIPSETLALAVTYTRIIIFGQLFFVAGGLFIGVQHAQYSYALPALAPLIYNSSIIIGGLFSLGGNGLEGFCWGVLVGAALGSGLLQFFGARKTGIVITLRISLRDPIVKQYILLSLPFIVAAGMTFSNEFVYRYFGMDNSNSVAILGYALRIAMVIVGVFGMAISVASYPHMARLCSESKYQEVNQLAARTLDKVFALLIPSVVILYLFAEPVIELVYHYGRFNEVEETAKALRFYLIAAVPMSAQLLVVRPFYADKRTWLPSFITLGLFFASLPLYSIVPDSIGIIKIPLISALLSVAQFMVLIVTWLIIYPDRVYWSSAVTLLKVVIPAIGLYMLGSLYFDLAFSSQSGKLLLAVKTIGGGVGLLILFMGALFALRVEAVEGLQKSLWSKIRQ